MTDIQTDTNRWNDTTQQHILCEHSVARYKRLGRI